MNEDDVCGERKIMKMKRHEGKLMKSLNCRCGRYLRRTNDDGKFRVKIATKWKRKRGSRNYM